ncbi:hypothetical protein LBMAG18_01370 [Alphaproteobacteria bacterium]|nr:hypothetical protein LBMAG18_01370 [Alphaproteobacteria bacterium]
MIIEILIIFILILLNAFFAFCEFAIVSSNKAVLKQMLKAGNKGAKSTLKLIEESGKFLSTIQIGITLVGILAGAYGGATIAEKIGIFLNNSPLINPNGEAIAVFFVVVTLTYFSIVIGELIPKQIALTHPEKYAIIISPAMLMLADKCYPVVKILEHSSCFFLQVFGIKKISNKKITEAEVKAIIDEGAESGAIEHEEKEMMRRIIALGDRNVKSIMTHKSEINFFYDCDDQKNIVEKIHKNSHSRYPVLNKSNEEIVGIIEVKNIIESALSNNNFSIKKFLKTPTILPENANCLQALKIFKNSQTHLIAIIDEYGDMQGIITLSDVIEAIVGIVSSNYSHDKKPHIVKKDHETWLVDGITSIEEIQLEIGIDEMNNHKEYQTIAGFIQRFLNKEPKEGDILDFFGFSFEIIDMDYYRIDKIIIKKKLINLNEN